MRNIRIFILLVIIFITVSTLLNINEFINNYKIFNNVYNQFFDQLSYSIYNGTDLDNYLNTLKESIFNLMSSYINLRSVGSAIIVIFIGIVLLVEPIKENFAEFGKRLFDYFSP